MEKLPLVKYCKLSNFQISNFSSFRATSSRYAWPHISKGFPSSFFLFTLSFLVSVVNHLHRFILFCAFFYVFLFPCFIAIGNFPALTSLLSVDDLTGSTVIPLIPHEAGEQENSPENSNWEMLWKNTEIDLENTVKDTVEKCSWQIHLRNTIEKYIREMQLTNTVESYSSRENYEKLISLFHNLSTK